MLGPNLNGTVSGPIQPGFLMVPTPRGASDITGQQPADPLVGADPWAGGRPSSGAREPLAERLPRLI